MFSYFFFFLLDFSLLSTFLFPYGNALEESAWSKSLCVDLSDDFCFFPISSNFSIASLLFFSAVSSIIFAAAILFVLIGLLARALSSFNLASFKSSSAALNSCLAFSSCSFRLSSPFADDSFFLTSLSLPFELVSEMLFPSLSFSLLFFFFFFFPL